MGYYEIIKKTLDQIEQDMTDEISAKKLSQNTFFSEFYYQRLFREATGESVMNYVKKRRLSLAGEEIAATRKSILDIALKYGYDSHEGFTRAFKVFHGITPTECRRTGFYMYKDIKQIENLEGVSNMDRYQEVVKSINGIIKELSLKSSILSKKVLDETKGQGGFGMVAQEFESLAKRIKSVSGIEMNPKNTDEALDCIMRQIKAIEDMAFQGSLMTLSAKVEGKAGGLKYYKYAEEYGEFTGSCVQAAKESTNLLKEYLKKETDEGTALQSTNLNVLIEDLKTFIAALNEAVTEFGGHILETEKNDRIEENGFKVIISELGFLSKRMENQYKDINSLLDTENLLLYVTKKSPNRFSNILKIIEDIAFQTHLFSFLSKVEASKTENEKIKSSINKLLEIERKADDCSKNCATFVNSISKVIALKSLARSLGDTFALASAAMDDAMFQCHILTLYLSIECAKSKELSGYAEKFQKIIEQTYNLNSVFQAKDETDNIQEIADLTRNFSKELKTASSEAIEQLNKSGNKTSAAVEIIQEFSSLADKVEYCAIEIEKRK